MFVTAEEAWFWFIICQQMRREGAKPESSDGNTARPCEPDDIYCAVMKLFRENRITTRHVRTLAHYGLLLRSPDARCREEEQDFVVWDQALDLLNTVLRAKGIVQMPEGYIHDDD